MQGMAEHNGALLHALLMYSGGSNSLGQGAAAWSSLCKCKFR